ncbi:MAG: flagellar motor protein MotB [bacterium]|nr:flagellar motor protein MotB [bacterium]
MAKKRKQEDPPKGSPAWMATFSDLMNLLLCFFVLLFSMSTVDAEKFQVVIASLQSHFSVLQGGGSSIGEGEMVSAGINQLQYFDRFYNPDANTSGSGEFSQEGFHSEASDNLKDEGFESQSPEMNGEQPGRAEQDDEGPMDAQTGQELSQQELEEQYTKQALANSESIAEEMDEQLGKYGLQDQVDVNFNAQYVILTLNGAVLFDSGSEQLRESAYPLVDKVASILNYYDEHIIEVEGHTDNVPIHSDRFADNNVLSMYRALTVADYLREKTTLQPGRIKSSGRGDYVPIADNSTAEGRALNRRVVIKIYNSYNSKD